MRKPGRLVITAWLFALGLNGLMWGQELILASTPGMICVAQLLLLPPLLFLTTRTLIRCEPNLIRQSLRLATWGALLVVLDLLLVLYQPLNTLPSWGFHWFRDTRELMGAVPTSLVGTFAFVCLLNCLLNRCWNGFDEVSISISLSPSEPCRPEH